MELGDIISDSFEDYKKNFKLVLKISFLFIFLAAVPYILTSAAFSTIYSNFYEDSIAGAAGITGLAVGGLPENLGSSVSGVVLFVILLVLTWLFFFFFNILTYPAFVFMSFKNDNGKMKVGEATRGALKYFWRYLGILVLIILVWILLLLPGGLLTILDVLFWSSMTLGIKVLMVLLTVILYLGGAIYGVYLMVGWTFSGIVLVGENRGAVDSLKRSRQLVRGRWWLVFGYLLLYSLVFGFAYFIVIGIPLFLIEILFGFASIAAFAVGGPILFFVLLLHLLIGQFFNWVSSATMIAYMVFFLRRFYLGLKGK